MSRFDRTAELQPEFVGVFTDDVGMTVVRRRHCADAEIAQITFERDARELRLRLDVVAEISWKRL